MVKGETLIFDNSNLNESYCGITTPLTFSFARRAYSGVYKEFSRVIGTPEKKINENSAMYDAMLGYICGRMYYNLLNWYLLISFIPGYSFNRPFFEKMLGVSKGYKYDPRDKKSGFAKVLEMILLMKQTFILLFQFFNLNKNVAGFIAEFNQEFKKANSIDLKKLSNKKLIEFYLYYEQKFSSKWKITIVNDVFVMIATGLARSMAKSWLKDKNNELINQYLSEIKNLVSTKPGKDFRRILLEIMKDKSAGLLFKKRGDGQILYSIDHDKKFNKLKKLIDAYIKEYGNRSPSELKMESKTFNDDREFFFSLIKSQLPDMSGEIKKVRNKRGLPTVIDDQLKKINPIKRTVFKYAIKISREGIKNREAARLKRSQVFGFARKAFLEFEERLNNNSFLKNKGDIFYVQVEEIIGVFDGTLVDVDLMELVKRRREELSNWAKIDIPERIEIDKAVYDYELSRLKEISRAKKHQKIRNRSLKGITFSVGSTNKNIHGEALVLKNFDPKVSYVGKILVTKQTDPGWTPVFGQLKGIVVERGGMLSHAAIVAREFGIPCISQVEGATDSILSGQKIEMDVKGGIIKFE